MTKDILDNPHIDSLDKIPVITDINAVSEFRKKINQKVFLLRDTFVTPRMYNQWRSEGLVAQSANPSERKWVSFTLRDYIWVQIVYDLRLMGCSIADIKMAKEIALQPLAEKIDEKIWEQSLDAVIESIRQTKQHSEATTQQLESILKAQSFDKMVAEHAELNMCALDAALYNIISSGNDWNLFLFLPSHYDLLKAQMNANAIENKPEFKYTTAAQKRKRRQSGMKAFLFSAEFNKSTLGLNTDFIHDVPHIKIPIKNYLWDFLLDRTMQNRLGKMELLSAEEMKLLEEIRMGDKKEISIKFRDGNMERMEIKKDLAKSAEKRIMEIIMNGEYCDIDITTQDGKITSIQKTTKKKL